MGKNPSFPFYPGDWTRDLDDQDLETEGAWIRICCRLWWSETKGEMTKPIREWARILRKTEQKTIKILQILIEKHIASGIVLVNQTDNQTATIINRRMSRYDEISKIRQTVGKLGGNPALQKPSNLLDNQNPNQKQSPSSSSSSSSSKINNTIPDFISHEVWFAFIEHRKLKKAKLTDHARELIFKKLEDWKINKGMNANEVLNRSIENGWTGIFELNGVSKQDKPPNSEFWDKLQ